jgi:hypothetical protein
MATIHEDLEKFFGKIQDFVKENFNSETHDVSLSSLTFHVEEKKDEGGSGKETGTIAHQLSCHLNSQGQVECN